MTARDTGFPLSTLCTTVDSGFGRGTVNIQLHVQLHPNPQRNLKSTPNYNILFCPLQKAKQLMKMNSV